MPPTTEDLFDAVTLWMAEILNIEDDHKAALQHAQNAALASLRKPSTNPIQAISDWRAKAETLEGDRKHARAACDARNTARIAMLQSKL